MIENRKFKTQAINDEILEKLSLKYRYKFITNNLQIIFSPKEIEFLQKIQDFCLNYEQKKKITHAPDEDVYNWIPDFGAEGYITRGHKYSEIDLNYEPNGLVTDFIRMLAVDVFNPQFTMAAGATILAINPVHSHHENVPERLEALKDMVTGKAPGCICITEPERGSDAVHMLTTCEEQEDGSFILNGTKIFNTNAPKAKWAVVYATAEQNNGNKMAQFLVNTSWDGWSCKRVNIPWAPKVWIGKEELNNLRVPKEYVLGGIGKGREYLFEGLVPERVGIACKSLCECWGAVAHAAIYANMRKQFDQEILKFQGVGFLLTDFWARTCNLTRAMYQFCRYYDSLVEKFGDEKKIPNVLQQAMVPAASQLKYQATDLSQKICYEAANLMGGAGLSDNTLMHDYINLSRIGEVVGGTRQVQSYIMQLNLRTLFKMIN
ncbi:MAG: acyl-CoA dehydrogenase family protein [Promethearchaeota archaeon]